MAIKLQKCVVLTDSVGDEHYCSDTDLERLLTAAKHMKHFNEGAYIPCKMFIRGGALMEVGLDNTSGFSIAFVDAAELVAVIEAHKVENDVKS